MNGVDAIIFTAGGRRRTPPPPARASASTSATSARSSTRRPTPSAGDDRCISKAGSRVQLWVIPTNEELVIARDTRDIVSAL